MGTPGVTTLLKGQISPFPPAFSCKQLQDLNLYLYPHPHHPSTSTSSTSTPTSTSTSIYLSICLCPQLASCPSYVLMKRSSAGKKINFPTAGPGPFMGPDVGSRPGTAHAWTLEHSSQATRACETHSFPLTACFGDKTSGSFSALCPTP